MAGSILVDVRSAVITGLTAAFAADGDMPDVDAAFQWKRDWANRERVWTRNTRFTHSPASMRAGRNYRDEVGTFEIAVLVEGVAHTQEWTSNRVLELGQVVEEYIADRKNNELGVVGLQTLTISGEGNLLEMFNDRGTLAELSYPIRYTARLT